MAGLLLLLRCCCCFVVVVVEPWFSWHPLFLPSLSLTSFTSPFLMADLFVVASLLFLLLKTLIFLTSSFPPLVVSYIFHLPVAHGRFVVVVVLLLLLKTLTNFLHSVFNHFFLHFSLARCSWQVCCCGCCNALAEPEVDHSTNRERLKFESCLHPAIHFESNWIMTERQR